MIAEGEYGIYKGNVYKLSEDMDDNMLLITNNKELIDDTFVDSYGTGVYSKIISSDVLEDAYKITVHGKIGEYSVALRKEYDNSFLVGTNDCKIAEELNLERVDKYGYEGKVEKDKIELVVEKTKIFSD